MSSKTAIGLTLAAAIGALGIGAMVLANGIVMPSTSQNAAPPTWLVVEAPLREELRVSATVQPRAVALIAARVDGYVAKRPGDIGDYINTGDTVAVLDTPALDTALAEAQAAEAKASLAYQDLRDWEKSGEVARARSNLSNGKIAQLAAEAEVRSLGPLFERGIIAKNELTAATQRVEAQSAIVGSLELELETILLQGSPGHLQLSKLEWELAANKVRSIQRQAEAATITAPMSGLLQEPPVDPAADRGNRAVEINSEVRKGDVLFAIADVQNLTVQGRLPETDFSRIQVGQPVTIASGSLTDTSFKGHIASVGSQASEAMDGSAGPSFIFKAGFDEGQEPYAAGLRVGTSAEVNILVRDVPRAIVVPLESIVSEGADHFALVLDSAGNIERRPVALGETTLEGIEVKSGLKMGETIMRQQSATTAN